MYPRKPIWYRFKEWRNKKPKLKEQQILIKLLESETDEEKIAALKFRLELTNLIWMSDYKYLNK